LTVTARGSGQDQPSVVAAAVETGVGGSAASTVATTLTLKKEGGLTKAQAEKKKIDARKKSLKRL
jgi:ubiquitin-conjugating enzyme E2 S